MTENDARQYGHALTSWLMLCHFEDEPEIWVMLECMWGGEISVGEFLCYAKRGSRAGEPARPC